MRTRHNYTIQYADTDASRHLRLSDLERYLLEAGGDSAERMGIGTNFLLEKYNCAWILTRMSVVADYLPCYQDKIVIETWVEKNAHSLSVRNYRIYIIKNEHEYLIASCNSVWTTLNLETRQVDMAPFYDSRWEGIVDGEILDIARAPRLGKIDNPTSEMTHRIVYSDLDYNNHCNSCNYLRFMLNACDKLTGTWPIRFDINYVKEVHKGEQTIVKVLEQDTGVQYCIMTETGEVSCTGMISKQ